MQTINKQQKNLKCMKYANIINTHFDQKSPIHQEVGFPQWHGHTTFGHHNIETELAQWADQVKISHIFFEYVCSYKVDLS